MARWAWVAAAAVAAGCGGPAEEYGQVEGVVTQDGRPLPLVEVTFVAEPGDRHDRPHAAGMTGADGRYRLRTARTRVDGVPVGAYRVFLTDVRAIPKPGGTEPAEPPRVPVGYCAYPTTPLTGVAVVPGPQTYDIAVPPPDDR